MFRDPAKNIEQFGSSRKRKLCRGFGTALGFYVFAAAEVVGNTGKVYAIDVQRDLLNKIKNEAENRHL